MKVMKVLFSNSKKNILEINKKHLTMEIIKIQSIIEE